MEIGTIVAFFTGGVVCSYSAQYLQISSFAIGSVSEYDSISNNIVAHISLVSD